MAKLFSRNVPNFAVLGEKYRKYIENGLIHAGINPIWLPDNPSVDPRISGHADISVLRVGEKCLLAAPYLENCTEFNEIMSESGISLLFSEQQGRGYPQEAGLNLCICGKHLICNPGTADPLALCLLQNYKMIPVKQGYSRCSVCPVRDKAVITADCGIADALRKRDFDVLEIHAGYIRLEGFEYGFIGGASFRLGEGLIAFTGHFEEHPDADSIKAFLQKHETAPLYLTDEPIFDIGSAVLI